jgi:hypothetical protein
LGNKDANALVACLRPYLRSPKREYGRSEWHPLEKLSAYEKAAERFLESETNSLEAFDEFMAVYSGNPAKIEDGK